MGSSRLAGALRPHRQVEDVLQHEHPTTEMNTAGRVLIAPAPAPLITAPRITKTLAIRAAVAKRTMRVPTAVPKMFAASLAPSDPPRKRPLDR